MTNPFALLADDDDVPSQPTTQQSPSKQAPAVKKAIPGAVFKDTKARNASNAAVTKPRGAVDESNGQGMPETRSSNFRPPRDKDSKKRGSGRGGRGGFRGRGREFERHSGTGVRDTDKKIRQAWGDEEQEAADATRRVSNDDTEGKDVKEDQQQQQGEEQEVVPQEPPVKTLDEYLAERAASKKNASALPAPRKPTDDAKWKNAVPLSREEAEEAYFVIESKQKKQPTTTGAAASKDQKKTAVEIEVRFNDVPRSTRGNGQRGGRGGRGAGRGNNHGPRVAAPNVNDASAFPQLA